MADTKITALTALTAADPANDVIPIVDVSDTTMAASGTTKKISVNNILGASGTATLASATITGAATVGTTLGVTGVSTFAAGTAALPALTTTGDTNTGIYYPAADTFAVTTGGTERYRVDSAGQFGVGVTPSAWGTNSKVVQVGGGSAAVSNTGAGSTASRFTHGCYFDNTNWKYQNTSVGPALYEVTGSNAGSTHAWSVAPGGTAGNNITFTQAMTLDASGNLLVGVASANANGGVLQLKSGITFPATQVAASDANTLDDYEEGTWTGTLKGSVSDPTIAVTATGKYTKVGRQVTVSVYYNNVDTTGASGNVTIDGLPFTGSESFAGSSITFGLFATSTTLASWNVSTSIAFYITGNFVQATHSPGTGKYLTTTITYFV